jgi:hypothetical protein
LAVSIIPKPAKPKGEEEAQDDYTEVVEQLRHALRQGDFRAGELLAQVIEDELYGKWSTFKEFVAGELRISERTAYRLIAAFKIVVQLKEHGCKLPLNERQIRPLSTFKPDDLLLKPPKGNPYMPARVMAWKRACDLKQGTLPTYLDVQREVNRIIQFEMAALALPQEDDEAYWRYRKDLQDMQRALNRATTRLADGDLEEFLIRSDKKSVRRKKRILQMVLNAGTQLSDHMNKLLGKQEEVEEP